MRLFLLPLLLLLGGLLGSALLRLMSGHRLLLGGTLGGRLLRCYWLHGGLLGLACLRLLGSHCLLLRGMLRSRLLRCGLLCRALLRLPGGDGLLLRRLLGLVLARRFGRGPLGRLLLPGRIGG